MWHDSFAPYQEPGNTKILVAAADKHYIGAAWRQRDIGFRNRSGWTVLVRRNAVTGNASAGGWKGRGSPQPVGPHEYNATAELTAHTLTLRVDNPPAPTDIGGECAQRFGQHQTNWNGVVSMTIARDRIALAGCRFIEGHGKISGSGESDECS